MTHYLSLFLLLLAFSCANSPSHKTAGPSTGKPLALVANEPVTVDEFLYAYNKNNFKEDRFSKADVDDYLELYINFKLKVTEAVSLGYDTMKVFKEEFAGYKNQLENNYLTTDGETGRLVAEAYERMQTEIKASHILIELAANTLPEDTIDAYNKIISIRAEIENGLDFGLAAVKYSQDPSAQTNQGSLGYFSALQMVYPFENAAYNTAVGYVSMPVRTQFGYHIIRVDERRPAEGKVKVAHIMMRKANVEGENKIITIYEQLMAGAEWNEECAMYSEDQNTAKQGGELPPFGRGQIVPEFEAVSFSLAEPGEISDPFQTQFGWHIVKLIEKIPLGTFDEMEETLTRQVTRDSRAEINKQILINKLKSENKLSEFGEGYKSIMNTPKNKFIKSRWRFDSTDLQLSTPIFSINNQIYSLGNFYQYLTLLPQQDSTLLFLHNQYQKFTNASLIDYEKEHLAEKYEDYSYLLKEYHDGILLFSIMEDKVWNRAVVDSIGLKEYYRTNKNHYSHEGGWNATIFSSPDQEVVKSIQNSFFEKPVKGQLSEEEKQQLLGKYNELSPLSLQVQQGDYFSGEENWMNILKIGTLDTIVNDNGRWYFIQVNEVIAPGNKPLAEIRGLVMSDYQTFLENSWVTQLRDKYPVVINEEILNHVYGSSQSK